MHENLAVALAVIVAGGVAGQWVATWLRIPSVLVLLVLGVLAGPVTGLVDPAALFGDAFFSVIAIAVGLILFEGGLGLRLADARAVGRPVVGLVTVGVTLTWLVGSVAALVLFDIPRPVAALLGAILIVSGPTVVLPLLESVHLRDRVSSVLRWECIVIDPVGAVIAVVVFEAILGSESGSNPLGTIVFSAVTGVAVGAAGGFALAALLRFHLVPDRLQSPLTLAVAITAFVVANELSVEAGLFATTVMGVVFANQRLAPVAHIEAFGEDISVLILGGLFMVLGATVEFDSMRSVLLPALALLVILLALRPAAVFASTIGTKLSTREKIFVSLIVPRGVVAASVATLFAVSLEESGVPGASILTPVTFVVIFGSVGFASLVARPASRRLRVASSPGRGVLLAGDQPWLLDLGAALSDLDVPVLMIEADDSSDEATERGLLTYTGALDRKELSDAASGVGVGSAIVAAASSASHSYLIEQLSEIVGRSSVYVVTPSGTSRRPTSARAWGRRAFGGAMDDHPNGARWPIAVLDTDATELTSPDLVPLMYLTRDRTPVVIDTDQDWDSLDASSVVATIRPREEPE